MSIKKILLAIGQLENSYDYKFYKEEKNWMEEGSYRIFYKFTTDEDVEYKVGLVSNDGDIWSAGFSTDNIHWDGRRFNKETPEFVDLKKILNTFFKVIKDFHEENRDRMKYFTLMSSKRKLNIYKHYIKKIFPNYKIEQHGYDSIIVHMK